MNPQDFTGQYLTTLSNHGYVVCLSREGSWYNLSITHPDRPRRNYQGQSIEGLVRLAFVVAGVRSGT